MEEYEIRPAFPEEENELVSLWMECFPDSEEYVRLFMKYNLSDTKVWVITQNREVAGSVYLLPAVVRSDGQEQKADMVYAVGVRKKYRGHGLMKLLLTGIAQRARKERKMLFLKPDNEKLKKYYCSLGFKEDSERSLTEIAPGERIKGVQYESLTAEDYEKLRNRAFSEKTYVAWSRQRLNWVIRENSWCGGWAEKIIFGGEEYALLSSVEDETLLIHESTAPELIIRELSGNLAERYRARKITLVCAYDGEGERREGAILSVNGRFDHPYVNLLLD